MKKALFLVIQFAGSAFDDAFLHQDGENRPEEAAAVEKETQILDIFAVKFRFDRNFQFVTTVDLRPTSEARADVVGAVFVALFNQIRLVPEGGSWSNDAHLADEDVENLRQFVEARLPQEGTDLRDVLFRILKQMRRNIMRRIDLHCTIFQDGEELLVLPDALLAEKDRAWIADNDAQADDDPERNQNNDANARQDNVDKSFEKMLIHFYSIFKEPRIDTNEHKILSNHRLHRLHRNASPQKPTITRRLDLQISKSKRESVPTATCGSAV